MEFTFSTEQEELRERVRILVKRKIGPRAGEYDETGRFPRENFIDMHQAELLGLMIPHEYGGLGADMLTYSLVIEEIARGCGSTALIFAMHCGAVLSVARGGTPVQRERYLTQVTREGKLFAWAFSEPGTGGNILRPQLVGRKTDGGYLLNGTKAFCTAGGHADFYLLNAQVEGHQQFTQSQNFFVAEPTSSGFSIRESWNALGMRANCSNDVLLEECVLPDEACLGGHGAAIDILTQSIPALILGLAAASLGVAYAAYSFALNHVASRKLQPSGKTLAAFQGVRFMIAEMHVLQHSARLTLHHAAWLSDRDIMEAFPNLNAAKFVCNKNAIDIGGLAMQVCGGQGYQKKFPLERYFRDSRAGAVMGSNLEVLRDMIAKSALGMDPRQQDD